MRPHALPQTGRHRSLAVVPCALLVLSLWLSAPPPPAHAAAYPHISAAAAARNRAAARAHAGALRSRPATRPPAGLHGNPARSLVSYEAMQRFFYIQGTGLYREEPYATSSSYLWPLSQALAATVSFSYIHGQADRLAGELHAQLYGLQKYLKSGSAGSSGSSAQSPEASLASYTAAAADSGGTSYYDDNEWVGIELVRVYELDHNLTALAQAEQIMTFVMAGWQTNPKEPCPGGIPFSDSPPGEEERNAVTNAPAAELGVQLYRATHNVSYLQFAEMAYGWVRQCLLEPTNLYADHLEAEGELEPTEWSYNQGSMIGAGVLLYQSTGDHAYLEQASATARAALSSFLLEKLAGESPFFPAVFFRNLLYLDSVTHDPTGRALAQSYVNYVWESLRLTSGLFLSAQGGTPQLLEQAAIVQIYALLSIPPSTYF
jgi:Glycosyl hydrolase family 76